MPSCGCLRFKKASYFVQRDSIRSGCRNERGKPIAKFELSGVWRQFLAFALEKWHLNLLWGIEAPPINGRFGFILVFGATQVPAEPFWTILSRERPDYSGSETNG
jgi:hypothetical protein